MDLAWFLSLGNEDRAGAGEAVWVRVCWNNAEVGCFHKWPVSQQSCHLNLLEAQCRGQGRGRGWAPSRMSKEKPHLPGAEQGIPPAPRPQMEEQPPPVWLTPLPLCLLPSCFSKPLKAAETEPI